MTRRQTAEPGRANSPVITASEIGRYVYCRRAWWLERVLGYQPENRQALERGLRLHEAHGARARGAERRVRLARWLLLAALGCACALLISWLYR
ncbi:MAG: hypothetical protein JXA74_10020 [Anaerolineae bacterium]|nr:hypothetical protein [Anaerolineae bacterium]